MLSRHLHSDILKVKLVLEHSQLTMQTLDNMKDQLRTLTGNSDDGASSNEDGDDESDRMRATALRRWTEGLSRPPVLVFCINIVVLCA